MPWNALKEPTETKAIQQLLCHGEKKETLMRNFAESPCNMIPSMESIYKHDLNARHYPNFDYHFISI